jgi:large subunit ribosomal protein L30
MIKKKIASSGQIKVTLIKSMIGRKQKHIEIARQLGLNKIHKSKVFENIPAVKGLLDKINFVLKIEDVNS